MADFDAPARFAESPVAMLATVGAQAAPHVVPVVFGVHRDVVFTAVDAKRKTTHRLRRLANIEANPQVSMLVDNYDDDWSRLWWVRADGHAEIHYSGEQMATGYALLRRKYPQYRRLGLAGPVVTVQVAKWSSWQA